MLALSKVGQSLVNVVAEDLQHGLAVALHLLPFLLAGCQVLGKAGWVVYRPQQPAALPVSHVAPPAGHQHGGLQQGVLGVDQRPEPLTRDGGGEEEAFEIGVGRWQQRQAYRTPTLGQYSAILPAQSDPGEGREARFGEYFFHHLVVRGRIGRWPANFYFSSGLLVLVSPLARGSRAGNRFNCPQPRLVAGKL